MKIKRIIKKEIILIISAFITLISVCVVRPDREYRDYIDIRVLVLLYCLMVIVKGLSDEGLFDVLTKRLLREIKNTRSLARVLVLACFFSSMLVTNDVALITFVPFALYCMHLFSMERYSIIVVVLQTIAANLGSMTTPIGNPQNLYLYSTSEMDIYEFLVLVLPYSLMSFILILLSTNLVPVNPLMVETNFMENTIKPDAMRFFLYCVLFFLVILTVLRILPLLPVFLLTIIIFIILKKGWLLLKADFSLLLTFVFLFVFVGNLGRLEFIENMISNLIRGREIAGGILSSQVLSNVPAAMLLSGFTENYRELIIGVNIGGLGTLIASMASIISYKFYAASKGADIIRYLMVFTLYNVIGLICLSVLAVLL